MNTSTDTGVCLQTPRLLIREHLPEDWKAAHVYAVLPEVYEFMEWGPNTEQQTKDYINHSIAMRAQSPRTTYELAIVMHDTDQLIGGVGLKRDDRNPHNTELGYCLSSHYWRQGYATEAVSRAIDYAFRELGFHRVFATVDPTNKASIALLKKLGLREEGLFKQHKFIKGKWRDSLVYAMLHHELNPR